MAPRFRTHARAVVVICVSLGICSTAMSEAVKVREGSFQAVTNLDGVTMQFRDWGNGSEHIGASGDGLTFYYRAWNGDRTTEYLVLRDSEGGNERVIYQGPTTEWPNLTDAIDISDDGKRVVYILADEAGANAPAEAFLYDDAVQSTKSIARTVSYLSYGELQNVTINPEKGRYALRISGDGKIVVFMNRFGPIGNGNDPQLPSGWTIYAMAPDVMAAPVPLLQNSELLAMPGISDQVSGFLVDTVIPMEINHDGTFMTFAMGHYFLEVDHIAKMNARDGGGFQVLLDLPDGSDIAGPSLNSTGSRLAYLRFGTGSTSTDGLYIADLTAKGAALSVSEQWLSYDLLAYEAFWTVPWLSGDGKAISVGNGAGTGDPNTLYIELEPALNVMPLSLASSGGNWSLIDDYDARSYINTDGSRVYFLGRPNYRIMDSIEQPWNVIRADLVPAGKSSSAAPSISSLQLKPLDHMVLGNRDDWSNLFFTTQYSGTGIMGCQVYDPDSAHTEDIIFGLGYILYDNGAGEDDVANDLVFAEKYAYSDAAFNNRTAAIIHASVGSSGGLVSFTDFEIPIFPVYALRSFPTVGTNVPVQVPCGSTGVTLQYLINAIQGTIRAYRYNTPFGSPKNGDEGNHWIIANVGADPGGAAILTVDLTGVVLIGPTTKGFLPTLFVSRDEGITWELVPTDYNETEQTVTSREAVSPYGIWFVTMADPGQEMWKVY